MSDDAILTCLTCAAVLTDTIESVVNGAPGPDVSQIAMRGLASLKRSGKSDRGMAKKDKSRTEPCLQDNTSTASPVNGISQT